MWRFYNTLTCESGTIESQRSIAKGYLSVWWMRQRNNAKGVTAAIKRFPRNCRTRPHKWCRCNKTAFPGLANYEYEFGRDVLLDDYGIQQTFNYVTWISSEFMDATCTTSIHMARWEGETKRYPGVCAKLQVFTLCAARRVVLRARANHERACTLHNRWSPRAYDHVNAWQTRNVQKTAYIVHL